MPVLRMPDGQVVRFPDDIPRDEINRMVLDKYPNALKDPSANPPGGGPQEVTQGSDILDTVLPATVRTGAMTLGLPGDVGSMIGGAVDLAGEKLGVSPETMGTIKETGKSIARHVPMFAPMVDTPGYGDIMKPVEKAVGGELYEPQKLGGRLTEKAINLAPALAGGEGSLGLRALQNVAIPAAGAEAGGAAAEGLYGKKYRPYGEAVGGIGAAVLPSMIAKGLGVGRDVPEGRRRLVEKLRAEGIEPTAGQITGSKKLQYFESEQGGPAYADAVHKQREMFTQRALDRAGFRGVKTATPEAMAEHWNALGDEFNALGAKNSFKVKPTLRSAFKSIWTDYDNNIEPATRSKIVDNTYNMVKSWGNGRVVPGDQYKTIRSTLSKAMREATTPTSKTALGDMIDALDTAMEQSISAGDLKRWQAVRRYYRNMLVIDQALGSGADAAEGIITPARLRSAAMSKHGRKAFNAGRSDFTDLANAGSVVLKQLPDSGTKARLGTTLTGQAVRSGIGAGLGSYLGQDSAIGPYWSGLAGGALGAQLPRIAGGAVMSPGAQMWLGARQPGPELTSALLGSQALQRANNDDDLWLRQKILEGQGQ